MQEPHTRFRPGQRVVVRDEAWSVLGVDSYDDVSVVSLRGVDEDNRGELRSIVTPFDTIDAPAASFRPRARSRGAALAAAATATADAQAWRACWTAATARIELRPWQLEPAIAAVGGATHLLLADEVGLGKTIQAGLILAELSVRGLVRRALVLTPAALREQWAEELTSRFSLGAIVFDHEALAASAAALPPDVTPWSTASIIVSSIDLVKRPEVRATLDGVPFDLLVVDEAHHLTPGTDRAAVVSDLGARTPWVVLATATPHTGDPAAYELLQRLGNPPEGFRLFRRSARLVQTTPPRRTRVLDVRPHETERTLLAATMRYVRALRRARRDTRASRLVASVIARRAASSAEAARRTLSRRLALLSGAVPAAQQPALPWEDADADAADADLPDAALANGGLDDAEHERQLLESLRGLAARAAAGRWSKLGVVERLLRRTDEPVLVFSEFRDVVQQIGDVLARTTSVCVLHGGLPARHRRAAVQAFTKGRARVLVATDAAGEGLNLHARCRLVVNMELPWTPLRLEQRIGRVDRMGQTRRVHALHLVHRGSYEATVIARLERRRAGARAPEAVDVDDRFARAAAVERRLRTLARDRGGNARPGTFAPRPLHGRPGSRVVLVFSAILHDTLGRVVQREIVPVLVERDRCRHHHALVRRELRTLVHDPRLRELIAQELESRRTAVRLVLAPVADALASRHSAALHEVDRRAARQPWQGSLFDRRAEQQARATDAQAAVLRAHLRRSFEAARALADIASAEPVLLAAWLV